VKTADIRKAALAAKMFIQRADVVLAERESPESRGYVLAGTKASGSLYRMSMELSRTLSIMRNPK